MTRQRYSAKTNFLPPLPLSLAVADPPSSQFEQQSVDALFSAAYEELKQLAAYVRSDYPHATLSPSTLVHEAWLKLAASKGFAFASALHFKFTAARAMRQILVEAARRNASKKRGGGDVVFVNFDEVSIAMRCDQQILALNDSLDELARLNPRHALLVEGRYFAGLEIAEVALLLNISEATAVRDWRAAKAWLAVEIRGRC